MIESWKNLLFCFLIRHWVYLFVFFSCKNDNLVDNFCNFSYFTPKMAIETYFQNHQIRFDWQSSQFSTFIEINLFQIIGANATFFLKTLPISWREVHFLYSLLWAYLWFSVDETSQISCQWRVSSFRVLFWEIRWHSFSLKVALH